MNAVIREGSFEGAARRLNITQSAVSQRIKPLEERIGGIVIQRGRPCRPTDLGRELCRHVDQVALLEHELMKRIEGGVDSENDQKLTITVAMNHDSLATWFPEVIARASKELNVNMRVQATDQTQTLKLLEGGDAIAAVSGVGDGLQGFKRTTIGLTNYVAVANREFRDTYFSSGLTSEALAAAPVIVYGDKDKLISTWAANLTGVPVKTVGHHIPSQEGYLTCCRMGVGYGLMPLEMVDDDIRSGRLIDLAPRHHLQLLTCPPKSPAL